jgi:hypothetical protein
MEGWRVREKEERGNHKAKISTEREIERAIFIIS